MGRTAARVWALALIDDDDPATGAHEKSIDDVGVRTGRSHLVFAPNGAPRRELRRYRPTLAPLDVARRPSGLILTSRLRTLFDCAQLLSHDALVCAVDDALHRKLTTPERLADYAHAHRWCAGAPAFRAALAVADGRAESPHETLVRLLLMPHLPRLCPQVRLVQAGRVLVRFDLADEQARFAVEADGRAGHAGESMVAKDRKRDRRTEKHGWHTERVTWFDVRRDQPATVDRVVSECTRHARQPRITG